MNIYKAKSISEAVGLMSCGAKPMAGCTNIYVDIKKKGRPDCDFVDLTDIKELYGISISDNGNVRIGALATFSDAEKFFCDKSSFASLYQAAVDMGAPQIRNRATLAGNICDASPACDAGPALMVQNADVRLVSKDGERLVNINGFFLGKRLTARKENELVTEIFVPNEEGVCFFKKVGLRNALAISVVSLAGKKLADGKARLAMGSVADRPVRLTECEKLIGDNGISKTELRTALEKDISPISDIRASREYRMETAFNLLADALEKELGYELI